MKDNKLIVSAQMYRHFDIDCQFERTSRMINRQAFISWKVSITGMSQVFVIYLITHALHIRVISGRVECEFSTDVFRYRWNEICHRDLKTRCFKITCDNCGLKM